MSSSTKQTDSVLLEELVDQIFTFLQAGSDVDLTKLVAEHPELADHLKSLHSTLQVMTRLGQSLKGLDPSGAKVECHTPQNLGDFAILRQIGRGGMGVVYEAQQLSIDRKVALKILPFASLVTGRALQRFKNEVSAIATLEHPHIVSVYSVGEERGIHYYAMQLVRGQSLATIIRELRARSQALGPLTGDMLSQVVSDMAEKEVSVDLTATQLTATQETRNYSKAGTKPHADMDTQVMGQSVTRPLAITDPSYFRSIARLTSQAADALQHAHEQGIVHRDIKPDNLLLDTAGNLFVTDFGLARMETNAGMTSTGDVLGTLRYMSPEQVQGKSGLIDSRTDIYSLGATLYELLTLQPIWPGNDKPVLIHKISQQEPPRPTKVNPRIPADLETIVLKSISKTRADRYQTAQAMADDLQAFLGHKPIAARRPTLCRHVSKWAYRQRRGLTAAGIATFIALSLGMLLTWNAWQGETAERLRAERNYRTALATLDELVNHAAEHEGMIDLEDWRRQTLEKAASSYTDFFEQNQDFADTGLLLRVKDQLTKIHLLLEDYPAAKSVAESGITLVQGNSTKEQEYLVTTAKLWRRLGLTHQMLGDSESAADAWAAADQIFGRLLDEASAVSPRLRLQASQFLMSYAVWSHRYGDSSEAVGLLQRARKLAESVANIQSVCETANRLSCEINDHLGNYYGLANQRELSIACHLRAVESSSRLEESRHHIQLKARCLKNLGKQYLQKRETLDQASKFLGQAIAEYQRLVADFPWDVYNRGDLAACQHNLAIVFRRQGENGEAQKLLERAQQNQSYAIRHKSQRRDYQFFWGKHVAVQAEIAQRLEQFEKADRLFGESAKHLQALLVRWPDDREIRSYLASVYLDHGYLVSQFPNSFGDPELLGRAERLTLQSLELVESLNLQFPKNRNTQDGVLPLDFYSSRFHDVYNLLAKIYSGMQRQQAAVDAISKAISYLDELPDDENPRIRFDLGCTIAHLASIRSMNDEDPHLVEKLARDGLQRMETAYAENPRIVTKSDYTMKVRHAYFNIGLALYEQGKYLDSQQAWETGIRLSSAIQKRFASLLHIYQEQLVYGPDLSARAYLRAVELGRIILELGFDDPEHLHLVRRDTAVAHFRLNQFYPAKQIFSELMDEGSFSYTMGYYMAMTLARLDPAQDDGPYFKKDTKIVFYLTEDKVRRLGTELEPEGVALREEAMAILGIDQLTAFQQLLEQAQACQDAGLLDRAIIHWQQVMEQEPEHLVAGPALGHCLLRAGQPDEAVKVLQRFTALPDARPQTWYNLGCAYALTGRPNEAFSALNQAIDASFGSPQRFREDEDLNALRDDQRFELLLQRLKDLPQQSSESEESVEGGD